MYSISYFLVCVEEEGWKGWNAIVLMVSGLRRMDVVRLDLGRIEEEKGGEEDCMAMRHELESARRN